MLRCHAKVQEVKKDEETKRVECLLQYLKDCFIDDDQVAKAGDEEWVEISDKVCDASTDYENPKRTVMMTCATGYERCIVY